MRASTIHTSAREDGFTLIELLVVVLVISVLAAIAIPAFLAQRENAFRSAVTNDLHHAAIAAESFAATHGGYSGLDVAALESRGFEASPDVVIAVSPSTRSVVITAWNSNIAPARAWTYSSTTGTISD